MYKIIEEKILIILDDILEMKNPTILMNELDLEVLKKENDLLSFKEKNITNPTYRGMCIKIDNSIKKNDVIIYDDIY